MRRAAWLAWACLAACGDPPLPAVDSSAPVLEPSAQANSSAPAVTSTSPLSGSSGVGVGVPLASRLPIEPAPVEAAPVAITASEAERRGAVLDLLAGGAPAVRLPIRATDVGKPFDHELRDKVSTPRKPPSIRMGATTVSPGLPPEVVQRIVRQNFGRFRLCYDSGLRDKPTMAGTIEVKFTIPPDGSIKSIKATSAELDKAVTACVEKAFHALTFPSPEGGRTVSVTYPMKFAPS